jgi:hypothetical protein
MVNACILQCSTPQIVVHNYEHLLVGVQAAMVQARNSFVHAVFTIVNGVISGPFAGSRTVYAAGL